MTVSGALRMSLCFSHTWSWHCPSFGMTVIAVIRAVHQHWQWQSVRSASALPLDWTAKDLKFTRTSVLSWLLKILSSASALPLCIDCKNLKLHFHTALTTNVVKFRFPISALPWLPMMWHEFRSVLLLCPFFQRCEVQLPHFRFVRTSKCLNFTSALPLCLDCQRCEVLLSALLFCQDFKRYQVPLPHLFDQDFQRCDGPPPHFISAGTSKDMKFLFRTSALPWLPKIWRSASPLTLCFNCQKYEAPLPHFRSAMAAK